MREKYIYYLPVLLLLLFTSCLKQQIGDYEPDSINDLKIDTTIQDSYLFNVGDSIHIEAKVIQTKPGSKDHFTYVWYYYPSDNYSDKIPDTLGNKAILDTTADMNTGDYYLVLEVSDTVTGIKAFKKMEMSVKRLTSEGWLLLTRQNEKTNLSIVSSENISFQNFLTDTFPQAQDPMRLYCVNNWDLSVQDIVIQTDAPNLYFLDFNDFGILGTVKETFSYDPSVSFDYFGTDMYFMGYYLRDEDGLMYTANGGGNLNFPTGFDQPMTGDYRAADFVIPTISSYPVPVVIFDEKNQRFMYQPYGVEEFDAFEPTPNNALFDINHFEDKILTYALGANDLTYIVGKSVDNKVTLYTLNLETALDVYPAVAKQEITVPNGVVPDFFTFSGKLPLLYFIADNSLYLYKISEDKITKLFTFSSNEKIVALQMLRETINQTEADNPAVNNRLAIAANTSTEGVFYTFDLSPTGLLKTGNYSTRDNGFSKIVDIAYKEKR